MIIVCGNQNDVLARCG